MSLSPKCITVTATPTCRTGTPKISCRAGLGYRALRESGTAGPVSCIGSLDILTVFQIFQRANHVAKSLQLVLQVVAAHRDHRHLREFTDAPRALRWKDDAGRSPDPRLVRQGQLLRRSWRRHVRPIVLDAAIGDARTCADGTARQGLTCRVDGQGP